MDSILIPIRQMILFLFCAVQVWTAYMGISHYINSALGGLIIIGIALGLRLIFKMRPLMILIPLGAFYGALNVWHWNWFWALILAVPGVIFIIPDIIAKITSRIKN